MRTKLKIKPIFCIPLEVKNREFLSKIFLSYKLINKIDCQVIIGDRKKLFVDFKKSKNLIYFYKGGGPHLTKIFFKHVKDKNLLFTLDEEGPIFDMFDFDLDTKISNRYCNLFDGIFVWGKKDLEKYKSRLTKINNIAVTGHPKYDLLKSPYKKIFDKEVSVIKKKYKRFIFFPSHYASDYKMNFDEYKVYLKKIYPKHSKKIIDYIREDKKYYLDTVKIIKKIASMCPKNLFIFRPHPGQDIRKVKKTFGKTPKNLKIIYKYTVTPWIIASDLFIHAGCTTSYEASVLKKKIIHLHNKNYLNRWPIVGALIETSLKGKNLNKLKFFVHNNLKLKQSKINDEIKNSNHNNYFHNNFLNYLKKKDFIYKKPNLVLRDYDLKNTNYKKYLSKIKEKLIDVKFLANFGDKLPGSFLLSKKIKDSKFKSLKKKEILYQFNKFYNLEKSKKKKFKIEKLNINVFKITS